LTREAFADFLDRLAAGTSPRADWVEHAVNHYKDEKLEEYRRGCVRLAVQAGESFPRSDEHRQQLRKWANELRAAV
jgi:hypothetical protein